MLFNGSAHSSDQWPLSKSPFGSVERRESSRFFMSDPRTCKNTNETQTKISDPYPTSEPSANIYKSKRRDTFKLQFFLGDFGDLSRNNESGIQELKC